VIQALLLDAHGTLLELEPPAVALWRVLGDWFGINVSLEAAAGGIAAEIRYYRQHMLEGQDEASVALLQERCALVLRDELTLPLGVDEVKAALLASLVFHPFPETFEVLAGFRAGGVRLVVASNWDASLPDTLERVGLLGLLDGVVTSAECGVGKPDPAVFTRALGVAGVSASEALHIGDSVVEDVEGARRAGVEPVLVVRGAAQAPPGVQFVRSLRELPGLLSAYSE
jgi:putative hydrolase of the HAD superfamily